MSSSATRLARTLAVVPLVAAPLVLAVSVPAVADVERSFRCNGAEIDFSVEREDGGHQVEVKVDETAPGARWKIVVKQNGTRFHRRAQRADSDGEIERDFRRRDTAGTDRYELKVSQLGADICRSRIRIG